MSMRLESTESKILSAELRHGAHPLLAMAAANAIAVQDPAGSRKLDKNKASQRIDPAVAMVMAVHQVTEGQTDTGFDVAAMIA